MLKDTKMKIEKMKAYEESLMECLGDILEKHVPHPQNGASSYKKKKVSGMCLLPVVCHRRCSVNVSVFRMLPQSQRKTWFHLTKFSRWVQLYEDCFLKDDFWTFCICFFYLFASLSLQQLMNKVLETPHDPYVTIDNTFWPPYVEMLLRYGIAVRHQENNFKIRLETFC